MSITKENREGLWVLFLPTFVFLLFFKGLATWMKIEMDLQPDLIIDSNKTPGFWDLVLSPVGFRFKLIFRAFLLSVMVTMAIGYFLSKQRNTGVAYILFNIILFNFTMTGIYTFYRLTDLIAVSKEYYPYLLSEVGYDMICMSLLYTVISVPAAFLTARWVKWARRKAW